MAAQVHTEGRQWMAEVNFSEEQSVPANFYVGLCADAAIAENATLSALAELTDTDYARQTIASSAAGWTSAATGSNDRKQTSSSLSFQVTTSGVTWTKAEHWFLGTTIDDTGVLIFSGPLNSGSGWIVAEGETLAFDVEITWPG